MGPLAFVPEVDAKPQTDAYEPAPRNVILFGFNMSDQLASTVVFQQHIRSSSSQYKKAPEIRGLFRSIV